ncbi:hypothetical protein Tco_0785019 [Tanacetum coccineum]
MVMEYKMKLVNERSCWLNKVVQEDGICVPHLQLCGELLGEVCYIHLAGRCIDLVELLLKGNDVVSYTRHFQELALLCPTMVTTEYKKVGHYIWRLAYDIQGKVTSSRPTKIQEAVRMAHELTD